MEPLDLTVKKKETKRKTVTSSKHQCPICEKCYSRSDNLLQHIRGVHGTKLHECPLCIKRFSYKHTMERHLQNQHGEKGRVRAAKDFEKRKNFDFVCFLCEKRFETYNNLRQHFMGKHSGQFYQCPLCIRRFPWKSSLFIHLKETHRNNELTYEKLCLDGMNQWNTFVKENKTVDSVPLDEKVKIGKYVHYLSYHVTRYMDANVFVANK